MQSRTVLYSAVPICSRSAVYYGYEKREITAVQKTLLSNYCYTTDGTYLKQVLDIFVLPDEFLLHRMPDHLIKQKNTINKKVKNH
jgi:hypothetical protein